MILLNDNALNDLIATSPYLDEERRRFIVDFLRDKTPAEREDYVESYADAMPAGEFAFIQSCFGHEGATHPLSELVPTEQPLLTGNHHE